MGIESETKLTLRDARGEFPSRPCESTLKNWIYQGFRGVRLETGLSGRARYTSKEAVQRFLKATNEL